MSTSASAPVNTIAGASRTGPPPQSGPTLAISEHEDDHELRDKYRPYLLPRQIASSDWVSELELDTATQMAQKDLESTGSRLKILVLYGSLRKR